MNKDRIWTIGGVAALAIVIIMGWFLGISPIMSQASAASDQVSQLNQQNAANVSKLASLKTQFANIGPLDDSLSLLRQSVPQDASIAAFITEINALCSKDDVQLTSVTVNDAVVYAAPVPATPAAAASGTSTPTPTPTPTPSTSSTDSTATATPAAGGGLVLVPVVVTVNGTFAGVSGFTRDIQAGARLYLVNQLAVTSSQANGTSGFSAVLTGTVFALPGTSGTLPGDSPVPAPTPTDTPTPSMTPTAPPLSTSTPTPTDTPKP
ncbi:MAG TPA: hypothetical protein VGM94_02385 [Galbitalea sp.]|jgi:Tfp pilus assembly protein PilO